MKKKYTKRQIQESIKYWQKQLKSGNYKKINENIHENEYENTDYALSVYGEMTMEGSASGLERWWLVVSQKRSIRLYEKAVNIILGTYEENGSSYAYIDPKTNNIVDIDGLNYQYIAKKLYDGNDVYIKCSAGDDVDEFDLSTITIDDCKYGTIHLKSRATDRDIEYCMDDGAVTEI